MEFVKIRFFVNLTFSALARRGILRSAYASLRMTAVTENGMRKTENGICENSLFREFKDFTPHSALRTHSALHISTRQI